VARISGKDVVRIFGTRSFFMSDQMATLQALATIALWLLIITTTARRWHRTKRDAANLLRDSIAASQAEADAVSSPPSRSRIWPAVAIAISGVLISLSGLYFLVRFIKWAWSD
jgi:hypothetical protein